MGTVDYEEVRDWSSGTAVRKDIVINHQDCTRERLIALGNHLSFRYMLNPIVVINIFNDKRASEEYDKSSFHRKDDKREFAFAHWPARYLKSQAAGLHELVIYPGCDHSRPDRVTY